MKLDTLALDELNTAELVRRFNRADQQVAAAVESAAPAIARGIDAIVACLQRGGRVFYLGSGSSGKLAFVDATECPPTFGVDDNVFIPIISGGLPALSGWREETEDDLELAWRDLDAFGFSSVDLLIAISASGATPYALSAVRYAKNCGAATLGLCCRRDSELETLADDCIAIDVGPEIIDGSTRLKAGTAQKMALNMLSSCSMIRLGNVYDNLMINVRPLNSKLQQRLLGIIREICDCSEQEALAAFAQSGQRTKIAILMLRRGLSCTAAEALLTKHQGHLKPALRSE